MNKLMVTLLLSLPLFAACSAQDTPNAEAVTTCRSGHEAQAEEHASRAQDAVDEMRQINEQNDALIAHPFTPGAERTIRENVLVVYTLQQFGIAEIDLSEEALRSASNCD